MFCSLVCVWFVVITQVYFTFTKKRLFEDVECCNNTQIWRHFLTCEWKICDSWRWVWKQISHMDWQKQVQPDQCTRKQGWNKMNYFMTCSWILLTRLDSKGLILYSGCIKHPSCGLDMTPWHLAFPRHKLSLRILCVMLCHQDVFIWVVSSHKSKHISSVSLPASVGSDCELCYKMAKSTEQGKNSLMQQFSSWIRCC